MKNNVVMVGLTISMHFQQFEEYQIFNFFPGEHAPGSPALKTLPECPTVPIWAGLFQFYLRIPNPDSTSVGT